MANVSRRTVLCALVLVLALEGIPNASAASQTWELDSTVSTTARVMERFVDGNPTTSGTVTVGIGGTVTWVSDEVSTSPVDFGTATWGGTIYIQTSPTAPDVTVTFRVGYTDADDTNFVSGGEQTGVTFTGGSLVANWRATVAVDANDFSVPQDKRLAFQILHTAGAAAATVQTGDGATTDSAITSPDSDPGFPAFELASVVLLAAGVLTVGGVVVYRRRGDQK